MITDVQMGSSEIEEEVLGCMLISQEHLDFGKSTVKEDDFADLTNQRIFRAIVQKGVPSTVLISEHLQRIDPREGNFWPSRLAALTNRVVTGNDIELNCAGLLDLSQRRKAARAVAEFRHDLQKGGELEPLTEALIERLQRIQGENPANDSRHSYLLDPNPTEEEIRKAMQKTSPGARVGMKIDEVDLVLPGGAVTIVAAPTGHGKTLTLINMALNYLELHPGKKVYFFSFEESREAILSLFLNTYINEELSKNNRTSIKSWLRDGNTQYMFDSARDLFLERKNEFFDSLWQNKRLNIFYSSSSSEELMGAISYLRKNSDVGLIVIDYTQLLRLQDKKAMQRQEELKRICELLKDVAVNTGLPIALAAQFNRVVVNKDVLSVNNIGEAGDIERSANMVIGLWNNRHKSFKEGGKKADGDAKPEDTIYFEILKGRDIGNGHKSTLDWNPNTGKLTNRADSSSQSQSPVMKTKKATFFPKSKSKPGNNPRYGDEDD